MMRARNGFLLSAISFTAVFLAIATASAANGQLLNSLLGIEDLATHADNSSGFFERPGILTSEILRARGYLAQDFQIRSQDGYSLRITRGCSPLINEGRCGLEGRAPILFVHGTLESSNVFVVNSFGARPSDLSSINTTDFSEEQLNAHLGDLPSAKSLPLLAMDFGHEVFIMSRRGFPGSQQRTGDPISGLSDQTGSAQFILGPLTALVPALAAYGNLLQQLVFSFDANFWNYSLDEQAAYDLPLAVDFVLDQTGVDKIAMVTHSVGGALTLMALSLYPELNDKLSALILWSPAFSLGRIDFESTYGLLLLPLFKSYTGAFPPTYASAQIQALFGIVCKTKLAQTTICEAFFNALFGFSGGQQLMRPEFCNSVLYGTSTHELVQLYQNVLLGGQMHHYRPSATSPIVPYDLSKVTNTKMSFFSPKKDFLTSVPDVLATLPLLNVPFRYRLLDTIINHQGYFFHKNTSQLAIIPSLRELHLLTASN